MWLNTAVVDFLGWLRDFNERFRVLFFFFNDTATTEIYTVRNTLSYTTLFRSFSAPEPRGVRAPAPARSRRPAGHRSTPRPAPEPPDRVARSRPRRQRAPLRPHRYSGTGVAPPRRAGFGWRPCAAPQRASRSRGSTACGHSPRRCRARRTPAWRS